MTIEQTEHVPRGPILYVDKARAARLSIIAPRKSLISSVMLEFRSRMSWLKMEELQSCPYMTGQGPECLEGETRQGVSVCFVSNGFSSN